jgi:hypothetical protein
MAKVDDLDYVWMTALHAELVIVVASVGRAGSTCCNFSHKRSTWYVIHGPPSPHPAAFVRPQFHPVTGICGMKAIWRI